MSTVAIATPRTTRRRSVPPLEAGDCLDQPTFHERYERMPPGTRAELIEGVVHLPSPVGEVHSQEHVRVVVWLGHYLIDTPGLTLHDNPTVILFDGSEPQPDVVLRIPGRGTRSERRGRTTYLVGSPELVVEVASSSESVDLNAKLRDYQRHGVAEYVAFLALTREVRWFARDGDRLVRRPPDADGLLRSGIFPGLWLDPAALLRGDLRQVRAVVDRGTATPAHAAFVASLVKPVRRRTRRPKA